jgi:hypothetical protein
MMPDIAPALCEFIMTHRTPRPDCATPPELVVLDEVDAHHNTSCIHHHTHATEPSLKGQTEEHFVGPIHLGSGTPQRFVGPIDLLDDLLFSVIMMKLQLIPHLKTLNWE